MLAGYFAKLVTLLINRKQKNLIPYVFAPESDVIDNLVYHVYQKSVAELLNKFLNIQDHEFEEPIATEIKNKQNQVIENLIEKVGPEATEEDHLNGASILSDMLETKDFYNVISKRDHILKLVNYALPDSVNQSSQNAALTVLISLVQIYNEKRKDDTRGNNNHSDDDDNVNMEAEETAATTTAAESPLIEILAQNVDRLANYLGQPAAVPAF